MSAPVDRSTVRELGTFGGFEVRLVCPGDRWGLNGCLVLEREAMIEFLRNGNHVQYYNLSTLFCVGTDCYGRQSPRQGLCLDGGGTYIDAIEIDGPSLLEALRAALSYLTANVVPS